MVQVLLLLLVLVLYKRCLALSSFLSLSLSLPGFIAANKPSSELNPNSLILMQLCFQTRFASHLCIGVTTLVLLGVP